MTDAVSGNRAKVYVVVTSKWESDVGGMLMHADGTVTAQHMSSSPAWLQRDLTVGFKDRKAALEQRYPEGYDVEIVNLYEQDPPEEIAQFFTKADKADV